MLVSGNPDECEPGFRVEPPESGTYQDEGVTVNVSISSDGVYLTWSSDYPIHKVVLKGGNGANIYDYGSDGSCGDQCLVSPNNNSGDPAEISHIDFCFTRPQVDCPPPVELECDESTDPSNTGEPTVTPEPCSGGVSYSWSDNRTDGSCPQEYTITRTFTVQVASFPPLTCTQTITVVDNTPPVISPPDNVTIECDEPTDPSNTGMATATDKCDPSPVITWSDSEETGDCPQEKTITRTWTARDACGNEDNRVQIITVDDSTPPVLTGCPEQTEVTVECGIEKIPEIPTVIANDDCEGKIEVDFDEDITPGDCGKTETIVRTWTATDACENTASCSQTIYVVDNTDPYCRIVGDLPEVICGEPVPDLTVEVSDECSETGDIDVKQTKITSGSSVTVIVTVTDACGNECSREVTFACTPPDVGCAYTPGYWKNHPEDICQDKIVIKHDDCSVTIDVREALNGNGSNPWVILARAYTAAYLNINCADASSSCIDDELSAARGLLCGTSEAEAANLTGDARDTWTELADKIDKFNNGEGGEGCAVECDEPLRLVTDQSMSSTLYPELNYRGGIGTRVFPNPFTSEANIQFALTYDSQVTVEVFNLSGQRVAILFRGTVDAQVEQQLRFQPSGEESGVFLYRITTDQEVVSGRLISQRR